MRIEDLLLNEMTQKAAGLNGLQLSVKLIENKKFENSGLY